MLGSVSGAFLAGFGAYHDVDVTSGFLRVWQRPAAPSLAQLESPILACGQVVWLGDIRQRD